MAIVPGVLYVTGYQGNGPTNAPIASGYPSQQLRPFSDPRLVEFVPGGLTDPAAPAYFPWYDGTASNTPLFTATSATTNSISISPSPGWTPGAFNTRYITTLAPFLGIPGLPLVAVDVRQITSNIADTINISGTWTTLPSTMKFRVGTGRFLPYNAQPSVVGANVPAVTPETMGLGSCWAAGGLGVGPDATAVRAFSKRVWSTTPWFHFVKHTTTQGIIAGYQPGGTSRTLLEAELVRVNAAAAAVGNTIAWKLLILDVSQEDIRSYGIADSGYAAALGEFLTWAKTTLLGAPAMHVQIVNHHALMLATTKPAMAYLSRFVHEDFARVTPRVALIDMSTASFGPNVQIGVDPAPDANDYTANDYWRQGERFVDTYLRQVNGVPTTPLVGVPTYVYIGDSKCVGPCTTSFITSLASTALLGEPPVTVRPPEQLVLNAQAVELQPFDPVNNANRSGTIAAGVAGSELTITDELRKLHPDGFLLIKRGANASALASSLGTYVDGSGYGLWEKKANQHMQALGADLAMATELLAARGQMPDYRGLFVKLATNDAAVVGGGAKFAAALPQFVADMRAMMTNRTSGKAVGIVWQLPQMGTNGRPPAEIEGCRAALTARAGADSQFLAHNDDDLERDRTDNLHETPEAALVSGRRMVAAMVRIAI